MTTLFACGEDIGFTTLGAVSVDTATAAARRTTYSRCSLRVAGGSTGASVNDGWIGAFSSAASSFWASAIMYIKVDFEFSNQNASDADLLSFMSGANRKIVVRASSAGPSGVLIYTVSKRSNAGVITALGNTTSPITSQSLTKLDIFVNYATAGQIKIYYGGTQVFDYSGDITTDGATSLDGWALGHTASTIQVTGVGAYWSEPIVHTDDTRSMSLVTMEPLANGNTFTFDSGSFSSVAETTNDDATVVSSATSAQIAQFTSNSSRVAGNPSVKSLVVWARAQRGATGPQNMQLGVRTAATNFFSADKPLGLSMSRMKETFDINPATGAAWTVSDLTAAGFNIGIKSTT